MKNRMIWVVGFLAVGLACSRESLDDTAIGFIGATDCKGNTLKTSTDRSSDQDCIQYQWVSGDTLKIKHVNAGFNCCPEGFRTELEVSGDTLIISEFENSALCDCNCLFDLDYQITGVPRGEWWIVVKEPYARQAGDAPLVFQISLKEEPAGEFCATRSGYPWRIQ